MVCRRCKKQSAPQFNTMCSCWSLRVVGSYNIESAPKKGKIYDFILFYSGIPYSIKTNGARKKIKYMNRPGTDQLCTLQMWWDLAIFFFFPSCLWCLASGLCLFLFFSTKDLRRTLQIRWRVRPTPDDVIFASKVPSCQVAIYWVLRGHWFLSLVTSPKNTFIQKFDLFLEKLGPIFPKSQ